MCLTASYFSGYCSEGADRDRSMSGDSGGLRFRPTRRIYQQQSTTDMEPVGLSWIPESTASEMSPVTIIHGSEVEETIEEVSPAPQEEGFLGVPSKTSVSTSGSADTLVPTTAPGSPSNLSAVTLVGSTGSGDKCDDTPTAESTLTFKYGKVPTSPLPERVVPKRPPRTIEQMAMTTDTSTVSKVQLPQTMKTIESKPADAKPSIMKRPSVGSATSSLNLTASAVITTSIVTTSITAQKTTISPPSIGVTFDRQALIQISVGVERVDTSRFRRPSVGYNVIPHAALCQHRYSLQLNGEGAASKVNSIYCNGYVTRDNFVTRHGVDAENVELSQFLWWKGFDKF